ncbi:serine hydrolase domain-containing protein [Rhodococcus sp. MALMAid1271]|uniref:serine hydrolase domain-containing protein n=1 Tax=Rhodococcus sp. MALMAid1271 TaxID=3411744 RepID=UPI003B9EB35E
MPPSQITASLTETTAIVLEPDTRSFDQSMIFDTEISPSVDSTLRVMAAPGAVVRIETPNGVWERAFGSRTAGVDDPMTVDSHFRIGSITKTMVATLMLQLVRDGRIRLDDPVSMYRSDVPNGDQIPISQLLDMQSGLFSYTESWSFNQTLDNEPEYVWDPEDLLSISNSNSPYFPPGGGFRYTNTNTILSALIIEQITGQPLAALLYDHIFKPLGLTDTTFPAAADNSMPDPYAHGYLYGTNTSALSSVALSNAEATAARAGSELPSDVTNLNPSWIWAAGGSISTAADVASYARSLVGSSDPIGDELQRQRLASVEPRAVEPSEIEYGLGLESFGPMIGHDGAIPGYQSFMGHDPDRNITVVVLCNLRDGVSGGRPANEIAYNIIRSLYPR